MSFVLVDTPRPHVTLITLNRPERMNAMAFDVMIPLREALEKVSLDNDTRVVVLTGAGHGFCSGADQEDAGVIPHIDGLTVPTIALRAMELLDDVIRALRRMHQPVIGAINGAAIGGGFCLSLATDIRLASETAYFRAAGINNGLTSTELGLSYLLPRAIGSSRAFEIMLTGRDVDAAEADRIGLVSRSRRPRRTPRRRLRGGRSDLVVQPARRSSSPSACSGAASRPGSLQGHMDSEGQAQLFVRITTENFEEAIRARKEKRPPDIPGLTGSGTDDPAYRGRKSTSSAFTMSGTSSCIQWATPSTFS